MDSRIKVNIIWEANDGCASADDPLAAVVARILHPEVFEASDRAEALLALADTFLPPSNPKPKNKGSEQRIKQLEAELALLRSGVDTNSEE